MELKIIEKKDGKEHERVNIRIEDGSDFEAIEASLDLFYAAVENDLSMNEADMYIKQIKNRLNNGDVF